VRPVPQPRSSQPSPREHGTTKPGPPRPVVVGVDGSAGALNALDWAAAEAAARHSPLEVVHVVPWPAAVDPMGVATAACYHACLAAAEEVLEEAVSRARSIAPESRVAPQLVAGPAGGGLLEQSLDADLLVLGRRSGPRRHLLSPSLAAKVVAHARCPVAVIGPFLIMPAGPSVARVVVGVDRSPQSNAAIGYAYRAAAQRGIGLTAVHAWTARGAVDLDGVIGDVGATEEAERQVLDRAVDGWERWFPGVSVHTRLVRGCPARALITESAGAALTVVGFHSRTGVRRVVTGGVGQTLIRQARGPVAVVRPTS
jgi:nucleotide-binding universal stress UspA family protein